MNRRIMIAGSGSGSGKTTLTCGLLGCFLNRGENPCAFKCGPDYIDPMFHSRVLGVDTGNLDSFFTEEETLLRLYSEHSKGRTISVMEGVMGYYDGIGFTSRASSKSIAVSTETPVLLVINCRGMGRSLGAVLKGYLTFEPDNKIKGVIFNHLSKERYAPAKELAESLGISAFGYVPDQTLFTLESRHLGLVTAEEIAGFREKINAFSALLEETLDIDGILSLANTAAPVCLPSEEEAQKQKDGKRIRIAVAKDQAFCFLYPDNLRFLKTAGCDIAFFSPLKDQKLPEQAGGLLLCGGYPELYAKELSKNTALMGQIRRAVNEGMPCIAECGGFLYLHDWLEGADGADYKMAGLIKARAFKTSKLGRFGYLTLSAEREHLLGEAGEVLKAHEFHYWNSEAPGDDFTAVKPGGGKSYRTGIAEKTLYAGFPHLYFYGNQSAARRFVKAAAAWRERGIKERRKV